MIDIFEPNETDRILERINSLDSSTEKKWGTMSIGQMLAHCCVTYEMVYESKHPQAKGFKRFMLKLFVKPIVVGEKTYAKNSRTAPAFLMTQDYEFEEQKIRLVQYIKKTQELGRSHFEGLESNSFGDLTAQEWNNSFYKHLDHHLRQFGA